MGFSSIPNDHLTGHQFFFFKKLLLLLLLFKGYVELGRMDTWWRVRGKGPLIFFERNTDEISKTINDKSTKVVSVSKPME